MVASALIMAAVGQPKWQEFAVTMTCFVPPSQISSPKLHARMCFTTSGRCVLSNPPSLSGKNPMAKIERNGHESHDDDIAFALKMSRHAVDRNRL